MTPSDSAPALLVRECRTFARYLVGLEATDYVVRCYLRAYDSAVSPGHPEPFIDRLLLGCARVGRGPARLADGYARLFRPQSGLRRRLILLLAILENSPGSHQRLNSAATGSTFGVAVRLAGTALASAACLLVGTVLLGPLHLVSAAFPGPAAERAGSQGV